MHTPVDTSTPYLSIVATSRNDGHGGNIGRRMQFFIDGVSAQAQRHCVPVELVMVEWNPPRDRPPLVEALRWPVSHEYFSWRIITVPPEVHASLAHADRLPLFQMIAKNVGIRRARAPWILSTNVDLLFSDELFAYLAHRWLQRGYHYRSDRIDVDPQVPAGNIDEQLAWCRAHVLRENRASGSRNGTASSATPLTTLVRMLGALEGRVDDMLDALLAEPFATPPRRMDKAMVRMAHLSVRSAARTALPVVTWAGRNLARRPSVSFPVAVDAMAAAAYDLPPLHFMACGDFMLMHRDDWATIHGHPEMPIYSMHLDSLTLLTADAHGIKEARLPPELLHFHIEHGYGAQKDYAPDLVKALRAVAERGVPVLDWATLGRWYPGIRRRRQTFAPADWGMASRVFQETIRGRSARERS